jgi:hypothetical protein
MGMERRHSAEHVAAMAIGSSLVVWLLIGSTALPKLLGIDLAHTGSKWFYLSMLALSMAASIQMYRASEAFKRAVSQELWAKSEIERLRKKLERPRWTVLTGILAGSAFLFVLIDLVLGLGGRHHYPGYGGFLLLWISPFTTLGALKTALRPKLPAGRIWGQGQTVWVNEIKPIVSEHWGKR